MSYVLDQGTPEVLMDSSKCVSEAWDLKWASRDLWRSSASSVSSLI